MELWSVGVMNIERVDLTRYLEAQGAEGFSPGR